MENQQDLLKQEENEELINKQRNLITQKFRELLEMPDCTEASIWAVIMYRCSIGDPTSISYYAKEKDRNTLLKEKLINRFAREQGIRYEDSLNVILEYIYTMKPINKDLPNLYVIHKPNYVDKVIPIFF